MLRVLIGHGSNHFCPLSYLSSNFYYFKNIPFGNFRQSSLRKRQPMRQFSRWSLQNSISTRQMNILHLITVNIRIQSYTHKDGMMTYLHLQIYLNARRIPTKSYARKLQGETVRLILPLEDCPSQWRIVLIRSQARKVKVPAKVNLGWQPPCANCLLKKPVFITWLHIQQMNRIRSSTRRSTSGPVSEDSPSQYCIDTYSNVFPSKFVNADNLVSLLL